MVQADVMAYNSKSATSNPFSSFLSTVYHTKDEKKYPAKDSNLSDLFFQDDTSRSAMTLKNNSSSSSTAIIPETISLSPCQSLKQQQPPVGIDWPAWRYLGAMFMLEFAIWGFGASYGVLLDFYLHSKFQNEPGASIILPSVGTVNTGIMALLVPAITTVTNIFPQSKFLITYVGLVVFLASIFLSSFAQNSIHVMLTLGLGFGFGGVAVYIPPLSYLPGWFVERRGLANGVIFSGSGIGGLVFPIILEAVLPMHGAGKALKYCSLVLTVLCGVAVYVIKPRTKASPRTQKKSGDFLAAFGDVSVFKDLLFWSFISSNTLQALASFLPGLYLPNYAHSVSLGPSSGMILLAAINVSSIFSKIIFGILSDHFSPYLIGCCTSAVASLSVFGIWGGLGSTGLASLLLFAIVFGGTSGCWTTLYFSRIQRLKVDENTTMTMYGAYSMTRGIGNIISGPISSGLMRVEFSAPPGTGFAASDNTYSSLIFFCGVLMTATTVLEGYMFYYETRVKVVQSSKNSLA
ncbi:hypothetical protein Pst134EA_003169 [Puccinia striiformis f. sp. tritici]|uniref:hypothetical protein n=1 Tax=Puccinia striiformis f. sp. tritici TaxID=168172 RepID=UPI002007E3B1|nr:hypothetical protein Pst134EA_003169 [Puccinia striiformis f. sp. tritici]KAH9472560.1 hypothetical protein Pst134EA_003169 [Puccinia striiformis f. sp. tritici]